MAERLADVDSRCKQTPCSPGPTMSFMMQPRVILLREGTDTSQGKGQLISNINACESVFEILKTTLGPCGMDKLIHQTNPNGSQSGT